MRRDASDRKKRFYASGDASGFTSACALADGFEEDDFEDGLEGKSRRVRCAKSARSEDDSEARFCSRLRPLSHACSSAGSDLEEEERVSIGESGLVEVVSLEEGLAEGVSLGGLVEDEGVSFAEGLDDDDDDDEVSLVEVFEEGVSLVEDLELDSF